MQLDDVCMFNINFYERMSTQHRILAPQPLLMASNLFIFLLVNFFSSRSAVNLADVDPGRCADLRIDLPFVCGVNFTGIENSSFFEVSEDFAVVHLIVYSHCEITSSKGELLKAPAANSTFIAFVV